MSDVERHYAESQMEALELEISEAEKHIFEPAGHVHSWRPQDFSGTIATRSSSNSAHHGRAGRTSSVAAYHGRSASWVDQAVQTALLKDIGEDESQIFRKIAASRIRYSAEDYGMKIVRYENEILNANVGITRTRLNDVKEAIRIGCKIYRDPLAIAALFGRKIPVCTTCGEHGKIVDNVFNYIHPMTTAAELFTELDDISHPGWGLFIFFQCESRCSVKGYHFIKMPKSIIGDFDMTDPQYKPWGDLAWEVR
jgi:hypothetical protein